MNDILNSDIALLRSLCVAKSKLIEQKEKAKLEAMDRAYNNQNNKK